MKSILSNIIVLIFSLFILLNNGNAQSTSRAEYIHSISYDEDLSRVWFTKTNSKLYYFDLNSKEMVETKIEKAFTVASKNSFLTLLYEKTLQIVESKTLKVKFAKTFENIRLITDIIPINGDSFILVGLTKMMGNEFFLYNKNKDELISLGSPDPYNSKVGDVFYNSNHIYYATTHCFMAFDLNENKWNKIVEKTSETGWFSDLSMNSSFVVLSSDKSIIQRFNAKEPTNKPDVVVNIPPFRFTSLAISMSGKIAVSNGEKVAYYKDDDWFVLEPHKIKLIKGIISDLSFITDKTLLLSTSNSFGIVSLE